MRPLRVRSLLGWLCMLACALCNAEEAPRQAASLADRVGLNHVYAVLDEETFAAIRGSELLSELASVDTGLPTFDAPRADSQRLYIRGRTTYVEILGPQNPFNEPVGKIGLALGVDELALLGEVKAAWGASFGSAADRYEVQWKKKATPPVPWYDVVQHRTTSDNPHLVLWVSAYRPEFLPWLYPQWSALDNRGSRADFLAPLFRPERLFRDVTGLTVAIPEQLRQQVARQLEALGYRRSVRGETLELHSSAWTLSLVEPSAHRHGLLSMTLATNRNRAADIVLGPRSVIEFNTHSALWHFK